MSNINIPDSVSVIGSMAFFNCTNLTDISIPDSVNEISSGTFFNCSKLKNVDIPKSVTYIEEYAFGYDDANYYSDYDERQFEKIDDFTIYGYKNTAAEKYANKNGFNFIALASDGKPELLIGDTHNNREIDINDCTLIQFYLADIIRFDENQLAVADTNGDGEIDILDVTHLQKYLAGFDVKLR